MISVFAEAGEFDGTKPLLCAVITVIECPSGQECINITPKQLGISRFSVIDFDKQEIHPTKESGISRKSRIENMEHIDGKLILQGAEDGIEGVRDGVGYTIAISEDTGEFVLSASGEQVAFIIFGACTPLPRTEEFDSQ